MTLKQSQPTPLMGEKSMNPILKNYSETVEDIDEESDNDEDQDNVR